MLFLVKKMIEKMIKNILFLVQIRLPWVDFIKITENSYQKRLASNVRGIFFLKILAFWPNFDFLPRGPWAKLEPFSPKILWNF